VGIKNFRQKDEVGGDTVPSCSAMLVGTYSECPLWECPGGGGIPNKCRPVFILKLLLILSGKQVRLCESSNLYASYTSECVSSRNSVFESIGKILLKSKQAVQDFKGSALDFTFSHSQPSGWDKQERYL
jgi:hypothetical protein